MKGTEWARDTVWVGLRTDDGKLFSIGTLSLLLEDPGRTIYEFDINPERYYKALEMSGHPMLPGFDPQFGWKQRHDKEIYFIYQRTFSSRRPDLEEKLEPWGLHAKGYSKWELLKRAGGACMFDEWRVTDNKDEVV